MKTHEGYIDEMLFEDSRIDEPRITGSTIEVPIVANIMIFDEHPLAEGRQFYGDGFTLRFEGVSRSVRKMTRYDENQRLTDDEWVVDDGPFPPPTAETQAFHDMLFGTNYPPHCFVSWDIDAERFFLIEPEGPWERYTEVASLRDVKPWWKKD